MKLVVSYDKPRLFDEPKLRAIYNPTRDYRYSDGRIVHRKPDKTFPQTGNTKGKALFHVERVTADTDLVWVVEGEEDVEAIEAMGGVAVCPPQGAGQTNLGRYDWRPLAGKKAVVVNDKDDAGREHGARAVEVLRPIAARVFTAEARAGKDPADHLAAGFKLADFVDTTPNLNHDAFTMEWLLQQHFSPLVYHVPGIIPEGFGVLAASPKSGKGWLVLGLGLAVAACAPTVPRSCHRLGPGDMPLEAERFRHVTVAIPQVRVGRGIALSPRQ